MGVSAGRVLLIPKGDWNAETTYTGLDWVRHNGATWVCKNTCTNIEPTEENSVNWQILARDGEAGTKITVDAEASDTSENPIQNKVIKKYVDEHSPNITVDSAMSDSSTNPIQNKVIKAYVDGKKVPTFERNNSIFAADQPFIVGANAGLITPTVKWYDDYGQRVSFKNTQDAQTSFLVYLNIPAHSVVLLNVFSINNEAILVKSRTTFYNPTDNADRANVQCLITVNGSCDINLDPLIIRNI